MVAFFIGVYLLCVRFTGDRVASTLVACVFMLIHRTPWDWWGLGPMITMSAPPGNYVKGFLMDLTPPLLLGVAGGMVDGEVLGEGTAGHAERC